MVEPEDIMSVGDWITDSQTHLLEDTKGAYVLWILLQTPVTFQTRRLPTDGLEAGTYLYAGNAYGSGGLAARLKRHFRKNKTQHWHIDILTTRAQRMAALPVENGNECDLVSDLLKRPDIEVALDGFGSTDCRSCRSHLLIVR